MEPDHEDTSQTLLSHVLLPVAHQEDALASARALKTYAPREVTVVHVVEKAGGAPDKTPVEQSQEIAQASFEAVQSVFPDAGDHIVYATDVVEGICGAADDIGASVIAFRPRPGHRFVQLLSGDLTNKLASQSAHPVLVLPDPQE